MSDFRLFETSHHENFYSSLLAFAMRQSPEFAKRVMNLLLTESGKASGVIVIRNIEREYPIQVSGRSRKVDLYVKAEVDRRSLLCLVEAKIESEEREGQLIDDCSWLEAQEAD